MLASLTIMIPNRRKFKWTEVKQDDFDEISRTVACDNLLTYPDLLKHLIFIPVLELSNYER